jgi:hypothetical protein
MRVCPPLLKHRRIRNSRPWADPRGGCSRPFYIKGYGGGTIALFLSAFAKDNGFSLGSMDKDRNRAFGIILDL